MLARACSDITFSKMEDLGPPVGIVLLLRRHGLGGGGGGLERNSTRVYMYWRRGRVLDRKILHGGEGGGPKSAFRFYVVNGRSLIKLEWEIS